MPLLHAIILGIIQGITEFLPISSTAHLIVIPWLLGWDDGGLTFDIALHVGTLAAVLIYFIREWVQIIGQGFGLNIGRDPVLAKTGICSGFWHSGAFRRELSVIFLKNKQKARSGALGSSAPPRL